MILYILFLFSFLVYPLNIEIFLFYSGKHFLASIMLSVNFGRDSFTGFKLAYSLLKQSLQLEQY